MAKDNITQLPSLLRASIAKAIIGKDEVIDLALAAIALLASPWLAARSVRGFHGKMTRRWKIYQR